MICLHVLLVCKARAKELLCFHQMLPSAPAPFPVRRRHLTQMASVPLRAVPALPCHQQQQETPWWGVSGGASRGRCPARGAASGASWQQELGTIPALLFPRHARSWHLGGISRPWPGGRCITIMSSATSSPQPSPGADLGRDAPQEARRDRQPLAGMKKPLSGNIALWRTTFFSSSCELQSHFFPLPFKEIPIKHRHKTTLWSHFSVYRKEGITPFSRKVTIQMPRL